MLRRVPPEHQPVYSTFRHAAMQVSAHRSVPVYGRRVIQQHFRFSVSGIFAQEHTCRVAVAAHQQRGIRLVRRKREFREPVPDIFQILIYNIGNGNSNHLLASIRMDGMIYFTGFRNSNHLSYGTYRYGKNSIKGSADFVVVVDNDKATVYIDGERVVRKADLPIMGDGVGLSTLSGTNKDFGTRCTWKDIFMYKW